MRTLSDLTVEQVKRLATYDPATGRWTALIPFSRYKVGLIPLTKNRNTTWINRKQYLSYRLAWLYMTGDWPTLGIDHKNGDPLDDRWENLREANHSQNGGNCRKKWNSKTGAKGVYWDTERQKWAVSIKINRRKHFLGRFLNIAAAKSAYRAAAIAAFGEFARYD